MNLSIHSAKTFLSLEIFCGAKTGTKKPLSLRPRVLFISPQNEFQFPFSINWRYKNVFPEPFAPCTTAIGTWLLNRVQRFLIGSVNNNSSAPLASAVI